MELGGQVVIVTGAGSGIGRASCDVFADAGAHVIAVDLEREPTVAAAEAVGGTAVVGSVADPELWALAVTTAMGLGRLGIVYLNAGVYGHTGAIDDLPLDVYQRTIDANIGGVVLGTRACVPALRAGGGGSIVVTASVAGIVAFELNPLYTLTKQAVTGFVRAAAPGLAPDGISIDAVCPGVVDTPMTAEALRGHAADGLGRDLIDPVDIARTALALATSEGTGRCRAVRGHGEPVDWTFPTWSDLARGSAIEDRP